MLAATATACFAAGRMTAHVSRRQPVELSGVPVPLGTDGASSALPASLPPAREMGLWAVYNSILKTRKFVDLTHAFDPNIPHWKGFEAETVATKYSYDSDGLRMCMCVCVRARVRVHACVRHMRVYGCILSCPPNPQTPNRLLGAAVLPCGAMGHARRPTSALREGQGKKRLVLNP